MKVIDFMKTKLWIVGVIILFFLFPLSSSAVQQTPVLHTDDYTLGPGDILDISVWKDEALTKLVAVLPDGKISFPLIGEVTAGGKTLAELRVELEKKLSRYVPDINLSVVVTQINSMIVYVVGRVNKPGMFGLNTNVTVLQALAMAGGLNPFAKRSKIKIFRETGGKTQILSFDYDDVTKGEDLGQNIQLKRGDTVVVP
jgi:polysaccharide export outer membrane protein